LGAGRLLALGATVFFAFNTRTVTLASSVLSEALFTVLSLSAIWATSLHLRTPSVRNAVVSVVLVGSTIMTRSSGIVLIMAIGVFAVARRKVAPALPVLAAGTLVFAGWSLWAQMHIANPDDSHLAFYTSYSAVFADHYRILGPGGIAVLAFQNA